MKRLAGDSSIVTETVYEINAHWMDNHPAKVMLFDIDDTLSNHGEGLNLALCKMLDERKDKTIILLTNCSNERGNGHQKRLDEFNCTAQLWKVGMKPDYPWLVSELDKHQFDLSKCAMVGDRPTMDMWLGYKAGLGHRVWMKGYLEKPLSLLRLFRKFEQWLLKA